MGVTSRRALLKKKTAANPANARNTAAHASARHAGFRRGAIECSGTTVGRVATFGDVRSELRTLASPGESAEARLFSMSALTSSTIAASGTGAASSPAISEFRRVVSRKRTANAGSISKASNSAASSALNCSSR
jgi:hypothetical protein